MALNNMNEKQDQAYRAKHGNALNQKPQVNEAPQGVRGPEWKPKPFASTMNVLPPQASVQDPNERPSR